MAIYGRGWLFRCWVGGRRQAALLHWMMTVMLKSGRWHGDVPQPTCYIGNYLGGRVLWLTKRLRCDGAPSELVVMDLRPLPLRWYFVNGG